MVPTRPSLSATASSARCKTSPSSRRDAGACENCGAHRCLVARICGVSPPHATCLVNAGVGEQEAPRPRGLCSDMDPLHHGRHRAVRCAGTAWGDRSSAIAEVALASHACWERGVRRAMRCPLRARPNAVRRSQPVGNWASHAGPVVTGTAGRRAPCTCASARVS